MPDLFSTLLPMVAIFAVFWFLLIRPQQRKMREQTERINSLQVDTRVMLTSGIYGTVRHLGTSQAVIEIAPGIEMTIAKAAISQIVRSEDEEFEYSDDDVDTQAEAGDAPEDAAEASIAETPTAEDLGFTPYPRSNDEK